MQDYETYEGEELDTLTKQERRDYEIDLADAAYDAQLDRYNMDK